LKGRARRDAANLVKRLEDAEARETAALRAQQIITDAIQRSAAEHATRNTVSVVEPPERRPQGADSSARGRQHRALEHRDRLRAHRRRHPGAIILSSFDPFRARGSARRRSNGSSADGRIHPARIEEIVEKVKAEMQETVRKEGRGRPPSSSAVYDLHRRSSAHGAPEVPHQLRAERPESFNGGRVPRRSSWRRKLGLNGHVARGGGVPARHVRGKRDRPRTLQARISNSGSESSASTARAEPAVCRPSRAPHGYRLAVARGDDLQAADAISAARPRRADATSCESYVKRLEKLRRDRRLPSKGSRRRFALPGRTRDPHRGGEREDLRRSHRVALVGHRPPHRERAGIPGRVKRYCHQGDPGR